MAANTSDSTVYSVCSPLLTKVGFFLESHQVRRNSLNIKFLGGIFLGHPGPRRRDIPDKNFMQVAFFCCFRQGVAGMSRDLGRDVPDLEKLYARKLWADFSYPISEKFYNHCLWETNMVVLELNVFKNACCLWPKRPPPGHALLVGVAEAKSLPDARSSGICGIEHAI